ncbi:class I SAM-dependent methyltransferase [Antarctobacter heliothermus]|uniref:Methyltransferase domain-containing protein n=1 Tax=Antarctobacter heliothermus TaxID=74033 RepID=A0A239EA03_9RHOB|nr:class I SAM-dependent methyltransferase [Antarctobacter heliothermus]SNS41291.1 Methyltransferase domain-containing protein [Antarctobacter heliothermus]
MTWDQRYATNDYVFGTSPSGFLTAHAGLIPRGARTLCVADGEGRNSVWLAQQGCDVTAFDVSPNSIAKAGKLASDAGVAPTFTQSTIEDWDWDAAPYDLVVGVFIQFAPPELRTRIFAGLRRALAPGGRLMVHGYTPKQVDYGTGGPGNPDFMYTETLLRDAFSDLTILRLDSYEKDLDEGAGHSGRSALIDLIADAPA